MKDFEYSVMRNTETLDVYRQHLRSTAKIGSGLTTIASPLLLSGSLLLGMSLGRGYVIGEWLGGAVMASGALLLTFGLVRWHRYSKAHPFRQA